MIGRTKSIAENEGRKILGGSEGHTIGKEIGNSQSVEWTGGRLERATNEDHHVRRSGRGGIGGDMSGEERRR